jgi:hypothetical protein
VNVLDKQGQESTEQDKDLIVPPPPNPPGTNPEYPPESQPLGDVPTTNFICPVCGRAFTAQNMLTIHLDVAHKKTNDKK